MDCLFCKIALKEIPAAVVHEDGDTLGFLDINPRAAGHTVVVPKAHAETILELNDEQIKKLFSAVRNVTARLKAALKPEGFTIGINHGKPAGQAVDHVHIHVIPRWQGDGGGSIHSVVSNPPKESLEEIRKKILNAN